MNKKTRSMIYEYHAGWILGEGVVVSESRRWSHLAPHRHQMIFVRFELSANLNSFRKGYTKMRGRTRTVKPETLCTVEMAFLLSWENWNLKLLACNDVYTAAPRMRLGIAYKSGPEWLYIVHIKLSLPVAALQPLAVTDPKVSFLTVCPCRCGD